MRNWLVWYPLRLLQWVLAATGLLAILLVAMVARPLMRPGELRSVAAAARNVDRSTMPPLERFVARDGSDIAYRHYPARGVAVGTIAIVVHGSSGSSPAVHAVAPQVDVKLIDGVDHMGIVSSPKAVAVVAENVAKAGAGS